MLNSENPDPESDDEDEMADSSEQGDTGTAEEPHHSVPTQQADSTPTTVTRFEATVGAPFHSIWPSGTDNRNGVLVVSANSSSVDNFVNSLPDAMLTIDQGQIEPDSSFVGTLSTSDNLSAWWSSMLPPTTLKSPSVSVPGSLSNSTVIAMEITFSFTTLEGRMFIYTSTSLEDNFQVNADDLHLQADDDGQLVKNTGVMLGLNADRGSASVALSLRHLFDMAGVIVPMWAEVNSAALNKTVFHIGGGINGLWFYPLEQLLTLIQFDVRKIDFGRRCRDRQLHHGAPFVSAVWFRCVQRRRVQEILQRQRRVCEQRCRSLRPSGWSTDHQHGDVVEMCMGMAEVYRVILTLTPSLRSEKTWCKLF